MAARRFYVRQQDSVGRGWVWDPQNSMQYQRRTEGKNNDSIYQFKQRDRLKGLQEILGAIV